MPYVGRGLTTGAQYQKLDDIAINNATTFTMSVGSANVSPDQNHLILVVNGVIQEPGTGFTVAGSTCTLASAITTSGHSGTDTIYGVIAGDAAFAAYDSIGVNALGVTAGTVTASRAIVPDSNKDIASFRNVTLTGELDAATLDISGNADIDGTTNLDAVDIDGAVQIDATFTSGVDGQGYDTKLFGDTSGAYIMWDTSADDLIFVGAAGLDIAGDIDIDGTANLDVVDIDGAVNMAADLTMGANFLMADDTSIGIADDAERIEFDGAGDISVLGANFGIGTATPSETLHIEGATSDVLIKNTGTAAVKLYGDAVPTSDESFLMDISGRWDGTRVGVIGITAGPDTTNKDDGSIVFYTASPTLAERMRVDHSGNVGIGTTAPARNLVISSSGQTDVSIIAGTSASAQLQFGDSGDDNIGQIEYNNSDNDMAFYTNATEQMTINSSGEVGIGGIAGSGTQLNVFKSGEAHFSLNSHTNAAEGSNIRLKHSRNATIGSHTAVAQHDIIGQIVWQGSDGDSYEGACSIRGSVDEGVANGDMPGRLTFHTSSDGTANLLERLRIDRVGTVFCNTATTNEKIRLEGTTDPYIRWCESSTNKAYIQWNTGGYLYFANQEHSEYFVIADNGVGIGTTAPTEKLMVYDTNDSGYVSRFDCNGNGNGVLVHMHDVANSNAIACENNSNSTTWYIQQDGDYDLGSDLSDRRRKINIESLDSEVNYTEKVKALNSVKFNKKIMHEDGETFDVSENKYHGFIAQEVMDVLPDAVHGSEETLYALDYKAITALLVKSVQELSAKVTALENA